MNEAVFFNAGETDVVKKYNVPGPRYTSFPTVPHWDTNTWNKATWRKLVRLTKLEKVNSGWAIYVHLPYCEKLCTYCGCNTRITTNHAVERPYIDAVLAEWKMIVEEMGVAPLISEVHLGGGTPTFFSPEHLKYLMDGILSIGEKSDTWEGSFEGHPNNTSFEHLKVLFDLGFRRVSFGVQDNDPKVQIAINRIQPVENVTKVMGWAREIGYESVNIDLVYGLPFQTVESILATMEQVKLWRPDRIAYYSYAHVPWIKPGQRSFTDMDLPSEQLKYQMQQLGNDQFKAMGYWEIGLDHFALPGDSISKAWQLGQLNRNFMGYTTTQSKVLIGLGVSAISDVWAGFSQNEKNVSAYLSAIANREWPQIKGHVLSENEKWVRKQISTVMCQFRCEFSSEEEWHKWYRNHQYTIDEFEKDELIEKQNNGFLVTKKGRAFVRNIAMVFDPHLTQRPAQFSATV